MKKNMTIEMNNGSVMGANFVAMVINYVAMVSNSVSKYIEDATEMRDILLEKVAALYSKELEMTVSPAKAWALIKAQMAFGAILITMNYLPLCLASMAWFGFTCLKVKNTK